MSAALKMPPLYAKNVLRTSSTSPLVMMGSPLSSVLLFVIVIGIQIQQAFDPLLGLQPLALPCPPGIQSGIDEPLICI